MHGWDCCDHAGMCLAVCVCQVMCLQSSSGGGGVLLVWHHEGDIFNLVSFIECQV